MESVHRGVLARFLKRTPFLWIISAEPTKAKGLPAPRHPGPLKSVAAAALTDSDSGHRCPHRAELEGLPPRGGRCSAFSASEFASLWLVV